MHAIVICLVFGLTYRQLDATCFLIWSHQIQVEAGAMGYSYETIFGPLIDKTLSSVTVEDAYIRSTHQVSVFVFIFPRLFSLAQQYSCKLFSLAQQCICIQQTQQLVVVDYLYKQEKRIELIILNTFDHFPSALNDGTPKVIQWKFRIPWLFGTSYSPVLHGLCMMRAGCRTPCHQLQHFLPVYNNIYPLKWNMGP